MKGNYHWHSYMEVNLYQNFFSTYNTVLSPYNKHLILTQILIKHGRVVALNILPWKLWNFIKKLLKENDHFQIIPLFVCKFPVKSYGHVYNSFVKFSKLCWV